MPPRDETPDIVRIVEGLRGRGADALRARHPLRLRPHRPVGAPHRATTASRSPAPTRSASARRCRGRGRGHDDRRPTSPSRPGERVPFVLTWFPSHRRRPPATRCPTKPYSDTEEFWRDLVGGVHVRRRLTTTPCGRRCIVLKGLTYAPTGGIVAAPTTSLPEWIGGARNWDYRYCWLRDAAFTLVAMLQAGYQRGGARPGATGCCAAVAGDPADIQIMYGIAGERRLDRARAGVAPRLRGVAARCGSATPRRPAPARRLRRGDRRAGAGPRGRRGAGRASRWRCCSRPLEFLEEGWRNTDDGIWEVRGPARHFTHSKVMAWVAFDRAIRMAEEYGTSGPVDRWRAIRDEIHARGARARLGAEQQQAFVQSYGSDELDASVLLIPLVGFLPADRPAHGGDGCGDRADAPARRVRAPLRPAHGRRRRRPDERAKACSCPARSGSPTCSRSRAGAMRREQLFDRLLGAAQRRRPALRGVRPGRAAGCSATSRRRSPTSS